MSRGSPKSSTAGNGIFAAMRRQVRRVPRGKVATYGDIAYAAGYPGAARQVAWALHSESRTLPWHRIVGSGGAILLGGEAGQEQRLRLRAEGVDFRGLKVNLQAHRHAFFALRTAAVENAAKKSSKKAAKKKGVARISPASAKFRR